jgi:hypothetical protein
MSMGMGMGMGMSMSTQCVSKQCVRLLLGGVWQWVFSGASASSFCQKIRGSRDQGRARGGRGGRAGRTGSIGGRVCVHPTLGVATPQHVVERICNRVCVTSIGRPARNRSRLHVGAVTATVSASVRDAPPRCVCVCWGVDWRARRRSDAMTDAGRACQRTSGEEAVACCSTPAVGK